MNKMRFQERRKFLRLRAYHLAKYRPLSTDKSVPFLVAHIKDIGAGGACLLLSESLEPESLIELKISFPALEEPLITAAKIIRVKPLESGKLFEVGVQFIETKESTKLLIDNKVKNVHNLAVKNKEARDE